MYKLKKEFKGQNVIVCTPNNLYIKLEHANQAEFEKAYKIKGNEKFIEIDGRSKQGKEAEKAKQVELKTKETKSVKTTVKK